MKPYGVTPPLKQFIGPEEKARGLALEIIEQGGLAWIERVYASEMGRDNMFQGYSLCSFSADRIAQLERLKKDG